MTFSRWQSLTPAGAAREVHARAEALPAAQRRAVFAVLEPEEGLAGAFAAARPDGAALEAAAPDLRGIPCVVKDVFDVAGRATLAGSTFLEAVRPSPHADGALAGWLREAGAVLAGKTHLHEFAYGITGENPHHGDVEHPRLPGRTSGGSSSGSAAAVAAGVVPLAFGTDTAGSIRVPAAFCGLFGFRMTPHHPWIADAFPLAPDFDTAGWFTAEAPDMRATLRALAGIGPQPARAARGGWLAFGEVEPELAAAQERAAAAFASSLPEGASRLLRAAFAGAPAAFNALRAPQAWAVHAAWAEERRADYDPVVYARVEAGRAVPEAARRAGEETRRRLLEAFDAVWERCDYLVLPATPCVAPAKADCTQATRDRIFQLTTPVSLAGLPALTVPVMLPGGFSTGLQVVAPRADSPTFDAVLQAIGTQKNRP